MDERERARQEARAKKDARRIAELAEIGITPHEASLLLIIQYGVTVPPSDLCRRTGIDEYAFGGPVTRAESQAALVDCLSKGWLQVIDEAALGRIRDELLDASLLGPIYGFPQVGGVDFTSAGAEQWFRIYDRCLAGSGNKAFAYSDVVHAKTAHYFRSRAAAGADLERWKEYEEVVSVAGPSLIGPWRAKWWRRFTEGYRIDVEQRRQGGGGGGGRAFFRWPQQQLELRHATEVLDRHNVTLVEWIALAAMENDSGRSSRVVREMLELGRDRFGVSLTDEDCFRGLEECLQFGWLQIMDAGVQADVQQLLTNDTAVMPVPFDASVYWGQIDFSAEGAQLYRMVTTEILGPDWEDRLEVSDNYYREEHRYSATEAAVAAIVQGYAKGGETPRSIRTVPIGPWCVYWWERFPSGYRLELTFGEP